MVSGSSLKKGHSVPPIGAEPIPGNYGNITEAMRREDPRLLQHVTVREPHVYVGELLEMLQTKTGIALSASDRDGAANEQVAIFLNDIPLGDALEALWSLLSYQKAERVWRREGTAPSNYQYQFLRPASVGVLAKSLRKDIQKDFVAEADKFMNAIKLPPEELKAAAELDPRLKFVAEDARARAGLQTLADALSIDQRQDVLRGAGGITIPLSQLPPSGKAFVGMARKEMQSWNPTMNIGETDSIVVDQNMTSGKITPSLFIIVQPFGGSTYVGGTPFENQWRGIVGAKWLLPGDVATDAVKEAVTIPVPAKSLYDKNDNRRKMGRRLAQMTDAAPSLSLLARLPEPAIHGSEADIQTPYNRTVADILSRCSDVGQPHKWRRNVLLVGCNNWFYDAYAEDAEPQNNHLSWSTVKRLRDEEVNNDGFLTVDTLLWAAATMSASEREQLSRDEFPSLRLADRQVQQVRELLSYVGQERTSYLKEMRTPQGLSVAHLPESVVKMLQQLAVMDGAPATAPIMAVRLEEFAEKRTRPTVLEPNAPVRSMRFVFLDRSGTPLGPRTYLEIAYPGRTLKSTEAQPVKQ